MHLRSFIHIICAAIALQACTLPCSAQTAHELIAKGDVFDVTFEANRALNYYLQAAELEPKNVPLLLRIARQYRYLMAQARTNEEKLKFGNTALGYGQRAAALAPNDSEAQLSPAMAKCCHIRELKCRWKFPH